MPGSGYNSCLRQPSAPRGNLTTENVHRPVDWESAHRSQAQRLREDRGEPPQRRLPQTWSDRQNPGLPLRTTRKFCRLNGQYRAMGSIGHVAETGPFEKDAPVRPWAVRTVLWTGKRGALKGHHIRRKWGDLIQGLNLRQRRSLSNALSGSPSPPPPRTREAPFRPRCRPAWVISSAGSNVSCGTEVRIRGNHATRPRLQARSEEPRARRAAGSVLHRADRLGHARDGDRMVPPGRESKSPPAEQGPPVAPRHVRPLAAPHPACTPSTSRSASPLAQRPTPTISTSPTQHALPPGPGESILFWRHGPRLPRRAASLS